MLVKVIKENKDIAAFFIHHRLITHYQVPLFPLHENMPIFFFTGLMLNRYIIFLCSVTEKIPMNASEKYLSLFRANITELVLIHNSLIARFAR